MKMEIMRSLLMAAESNGIPDQWMEKRNIQTDADIQTAVTDWNDLKKLVQDPDGLQADADIAAWSSARARTEAKLG